MKKRPGRRRHCDDAAPAAGADGRRLRALRRANISASTAWTARSSAYAKPGALVMHPGPMNRGVEIASDIADDIEVSLIPEQVEMGVAIRMAVLDALARGLHAGNDRRRGMKRRIAFRNARLIDPASGLDAKGGLLVENGRIADVGPRLFNDAEPERSGNHRLPRAGAGARPDRLPRLHRRARQRTSRNAWNRPARAAAAGGVTTMIVMPNTDPVIDEPSLVDFILRRAAATAKVRVLPMAALTKGLAGETMTEIGLLKEAGAVAFTDGDRTVANARVMRRALAYAATFDALVVGHAEDPELVEGRQRSPKANSPRGWACPPRPGHRRSHDRGARHPPGRTDRRALSFRHRSPPAPAWRRSPTPRRAGLPITCGVAAHHLTLNELDVGPYYTFRKVSRRCAAKPTAPPWWKAWRPA